MPMISIRCSSSTPYPSASNIRRIWRFRPSRRVMETTRFFNSVFSFRPPESPFRFSTNAHSHGNVFAVTIRSTLSLRVGVLITRPFLTVRKSTSRIGRSKTITYFLSFRAPPRSTAFGTRPSLVNKINPVESLSSLPTGNTRALLYWSAVIMLLRSRESVVHVMPLGFQNFRYTNCDVRFCVSSRFDTSPSMTFIVSHATTRPSRKTLSPGNTRAPAVTTSPFTVTRPCATSLSLSRRDKKSLKHLFTRTPFAPTAFLFFVSSEPPIITAWTSPRSPETSTTRKSSPSPSGMEDRAHARDRRWPA
mmetsp:Transcript_5253/g.19661  ORF Transcript_5253/g.19661 Transcript_5253/m.19661 type:complete len:305 (-) Transcript_5253:474-1388(-)